MSKNAPGKLNTFVGTDINIEEVNAIIANFKNKLDDIAPVSQEAILRKAAYKLSHTIFQKPSTSINSALKDALDIGDGPQEAISISAKKIPACLVPNKLKGLSST